MTPGVILILVGGLIIAAHGPNKRRHNHYSFVLVVRRRLVGPGPSVRRHKMTTLRVVISAAAHCSLATQCGGLAATISGERTRAVAARLGGQAAFGVCPPSGGPVLAAWPRDRQCGLAAARTVAATVWRPHGGRRTLRRSCGGNTLYCPAYLRRRARRRTDLTLVKSALILGPKAEY
jgi:hypothetical protein